MSNMRANYYQINDWVHYVVPRQISEIHKDCVVLDDSTNTTPFELLKPVPITAQALRDNGFEYQPQQAVDGRLEEEYYYIPDTDITIRDRWHGWMFDGIDNTAFYPLHIELSNDTLMLQQALRRCGFEDIADNWIVP